MATVALTLLVRSHDEIVGALLFPAPAAHQASIETLVAEWHHRYIVARPDGTMALPNGLVLMAWEAEVLALPMAYAAVLSVAGDPVGVKLTATAEEARAWLGLMRSRGAASGSVIALGAMSLPRRDIDRPRWFLANDQPDPAARPVAPLPAAPAPAQRLAALAQLLSRVAQAVPPARDLADEVCPRCQDMPLSADPALDHTEASGRRICLACHRLDLLRAERQRQHPSA